MVSSLKEMAKSLSEPSVILVIHAHCEEDQATIAGNSYPELIDDYYGFPERPYQIQYPAPGHPTASGIPAKLDEQRGFDHGLFIPLMLMHPQAAISCLQLPLLKNLHPGQHTNLGKTIPSLRKKNVLIVDSGMSFHNLKRKRFFSSSNDGNKENDKFDSCLVDTGASRNFQPDEREQRLIKWQKTPFARYCHSREGHLLPLHIYNGAACIDTPTATVVFNQKIMGKKMANFFYGSSRKKSINSSEKYITTHQTSHRNSAEDQYERNKIGKYSRSMRFYIGNNLLRDEQCLVSARRET